MFLVSLDKDKQKGMEALAEKMFIYLDLQVSSCLQTQILQSFFWCTAACNMLFKDNWATSMMILIMHRQQLKKAFLSVWSNDWGQAYKLLVLFHASQLQPWQIKKKKKQKGKKKNICRTLLTYKDVFQHSSSIWKCLFHLTEFANHIFSPQNNLQCGNASICYKLFSSFCWRGSKKKRIVAESMTCTKQQATASTYFAVAPIRLNAKHIGLL